MNYGLDLSLNTEEKAELYNFPFQLFLCDGVWHLLKRRYTILNGKKVNFMIKIHDYDSIGELLFDFLQNRHWFCATSSGAKQRIEKDIYNIYFFSSKSSKNFTLKQKFMLTQQFTRRETRGAKVISAPIMSSLHDVASSLRISTPESFGDALDLAQESKFKIPENDILEFEDSDQLIAWALSYLVDNNEIINRCKTCDKLYVEDHGNSRYCSKLCYENRKKSGSFLGVDEIQRQYKCINEWFRRKAKSKAEYIYFSNVTFPDSYNELELCSKLKGISTMTHLSETTLFSSDFELIKAAYKSSYSARYSELKEAKNALNCGEISEGEYQKSLNSFLSWLDNVRTQLNCFKLFHSSRNK